MHRLVLAAIVIAGCVGCDRVTKELAVAQLKSTPMRSFLGDTFRLTYAENPGAFLGLGGKMGGPLQFWILTVGVGVLLIGMCVMLVLNDKLNRMGTAGLALLLGGGLSNWYDRLVNDGRVVDFLNMGIGPLRTGIFNIADVGIMVGAGMLVISGMKKEPPEQPVPPPAEVS